MQASVIADRSPRFPSTHWSMVLSAGKHGGKDARTALEALCRAYWYPLYSFVRRRGHDAFTAQDVTQEFFAQFLAAGGVNAADPMRGRFRSFLLGSMRHFLANEHKRRTAIKRGGHVATIPIDATTMDERYRLEPQSPELTPEEAFDRAWALQVIERALAALESDYGQSGRGELFRRLRAVVWGGQEDPVDTLAADLGMNPGAVKVAIHRLRRRLREQLRLEVADTLGPDCEPDEELRVLLAALRPARAQVM